LRVVLHAKRRRRQLLQVLDRLQRDAALRTFLRGKIEQQDRHAGIDQVRRDLGAHYASAEHGHLANVQVAYVLPPEIMFSSASMLDSTFAQNNASSFSISVFEPARAARMVDAVSGSSLAK